MSTHHVPMEFPLTPAQQSELDAFCADHTALSDIGAFLSQKFGVELSLDPAIVAGFAEDTSHLPGHADGVARPSDERQCAAVMRACQQAHVPITLSGGRTNLTGSATPEGGIILSTANLTEPAVQIVPSTKQATVPPGLLLEQVRNEILRQSSNTLWLPVDPTSRAEASVGGCIACNASGFTPGDQGATRHWVAALRCLLPDGSLIIAKRGEFVSENGEFILENGDDTIRWPVPTHPRVSIKNAGGPYSATDGCMDLIDLIVGSEGLFGLVTACTLDLAPRPQQHLDLFLSLPTESDALKLLDCVTKHCGGDLSSLSACEYFGVHCRKYMDHAERFFHANDQVAVYIQEPLVECDPLDAAEVWLERFMDAELELSEEGILMLDTDSLRALFMEARHSMPANALEVVQKRDAFTIMTDCVVPPEHFAEFLAFTHATIDAQSLDYLSFGHLGDCHLHFTLLPHKQQIDTGVAVYDAIIAKSAELGGVYSGEHGTGKRKRNDFLCCHGDAGIASVTRCKQALDPHWLLNRGNVVKLPA